jgi:hypothetical protein
MNEKTTPFISKFLASLSVLNLLTMMLCVFSIFYARDSVSSSGLFLDLVVGPAGNVLLGILAKAIGGLTWLFVIVNIAISLALLIAALITRNAKQQLPRQKFARAV